MTSFRQCRLLKRTFDNFLIHWSSLNPLACGGYVPATDKKLCAQDRPESIWSGQNKIHGRKGWKQRFAKKKCTSLHANWILQPDISNIESRSRTASVILPSTGDFPFGNPGEDIKFGDNGDGWGCSKSWDMILSGFLSCFRFCRGGTRKESSRSSLRLGEEAFMTSQLAWRQRAVPLLLWKQMLDVQQLKGQIVLRWEV